jgi:hypothetical protein
MLEKCYAKFHVENPKSNASNDVWAVIIIVIVILIDTVARAIDVV